VRAHTQLHCQSHTRTVVRECCKGDDASQWDNGKFDPHNAQPLNRSSTKSCICDKVLDAYPQAKFSHDALMGFFSRMHETAHQKCLLGFFGFFQRPTAEALNRFSCKIRQTVWFHKMMCLFGVRKQKFNI